MYKKDFLEQKYCEINIKIYEKFVQYSDKRWRLWYTTCKSV